MRIGVLLVREHLRLALHAVAVLRTVFVPGLDLGGGAALEAALAIAHSLKTFRRRYRSRVHPVAVLDLLLLDEDNPRSLAHQLVQLNGVVAELTSEVAPRRGVAQRLSLDILTQVRLFDVTTVSQVTAIRMGECGLTWMSFGR